MMLSYRLKKMLKTLHAQGVDSVAPPLEHVFDNYYQCGKLLGEGGYSKAYECMSKLLPRNPNVAVKITSRTKLSAEDAESIRHEVAIMRSIHHPNIVGFVDFFEDQQSFYTVLELLQGGELFDRIVKKSFYNEQEAREVVFSILQGIKACHDRNIVHR